MTGRPLATTGDSFLSCPILLARPTCFWKFLGTPFLARYYLPWVTVVTKSIEFKVSDHWSLTSQPDLQITSQNRTSWLEGFFDLRFGGFQGSLRILSCICFHLFNISLWFIARPPDQTQSVSLVKCSSVCRMSTFTIRKFLAGCFLLFSNSCIWLIDHPQSSAANNRPKQKK